MDIRVKTGFFAHPKTVKLTRRLGHEGPLCLIRLWAWTAENKPEGFLGSDVENIEIAAGWSGDEGKFVAICCEVGFLDECESGYSIHDWAEHNPWAADSKKRSAIARNNVLKRWNKERKETQSDTDSIPAVYKRHTGSNTKNEIGNTPFPSSPLPSFPKNKNSASGDAGKNGQRIYLTKSGRNLKGESLKHFDLFWAAFDYKKGKAEATDAWVDIKNLTGNLAEKIVASAKREATARGKLPPGRTSKMAQGWLSGRRWEDEPEKSQKPQVAL